MNWLKKLFGFCDGGCVPHLSFDERYPNHKIVGYNLFMVGNPILDNGKKWYPVTKTRKFYVTSESGEDISNQHPMNYVSYNSEIVEYYSDWIEAEGYAKRSNLSSERKREIS